MQRLRTISFLCAALVGASCAAFGQETPAPAAEPKTSPPPLKEVAPGVFEIGLVRLDKEKKTVSFPAAIHMTEGLIEYWLVSSAGKLHESLLRTDAEPYHIHVAMLLLGAKGARPFKPEDLKHDPSIKGDKVTLFLTAETGEGRKRLRAEETILNTKSAGPMTTGHWIYNGSWIFEGTFIAQRERSIVAIISDRDALINNPRPGREDDEIWKVKPDLDLPLNMPVEVSIQLDQNKNPEAP